MGKKNFDRKKAVRFTLLPGPIVDGKPTVLYKPVQTRKSKVSKKMRKETISKLADIDEVTINGKKVQQNEIPAYVLQQIRGRGDLIYNQMKGMPKQQEAEGDLYQIQDAKQEDLQLQEYDQENIDIEQKPVIREEENQDQQWEDDDEEWSDQDMQEIQIQDEQAEKAQKFQTKVQEFPTIQQTKTVNIEGKDYQLTQKQLDILQTVIPQNYEKMDFGGLQFKKYNEDGLLLSDKQKYEKYLLGQNEKVVVIDSYQFVPPKPIDTYDTDLLPAQINKDANIKEVEQALNYVGEQEVYEQMQDDFFVKMIQMELQTNPPNKPKNEITANQPLNQKPSAKKQSKKQPKIQIASQVSQKKAQLTEKELQQQLNKAVYNFQHNIEQKKEKKQIDQSSDEQEEPFSQTNHSMNFTDLQKRQEYKGNDGELDWRCLTKKQKKEYMKTKVIRDFYDELRDRQIEQKLQGKNNVKVEQLHLKQLVKYIPYQEDLVMQKALEQDLKKQVHLSDSDQAAYESLSDQDDIVSFHQRTSIIATNLSVIQQPKNKPKKLKKDQVETEEQHNITKIKVVPQKRDREQTAQQRKQRKNKLKQLKKQRKQQKKQFAERFSKIKKETNRSQNTTNPLNKISYVKIY